MYLSPVDGACIAVAQCAGSRDNSRIAASMAHVGGIWVDQTIVQLLAGHLVDQCPRLEIQESGSPLETRERNVLQGILGGLTNRKIGDNMGLSESSVKNIVQRLFAKTGVKTLTQLVRVALKGSLNLPAARQSLD